MVQMIKNGDYFYTYGASSQKMASVLVKTSSIGTDYIETEPDGLWDNNLDSLPVCDGCLRCE